VHYSVPAFIGSAATPTLNKPNAVAHDALSCVIPEFSLGDLGGLTVYGIYITAASFENEGSESWCIESQQPVSCYIEHDAERKVRHM